MFATSTLTTYLPLSLRERRRHVTRSGRHGRSAPAPNFTLRAGVDPTAHPDPTKRYCSFTKP